MTTDEFIEKLAVDGFDSGSLHDGAVRVVTDRLLAVQCDGGHPVESLLSLMRFIGVTPDALMEAVETQDRETYGPGRMTT